MKAENLKEKNCLQKDSVEHESYAEVRMSFVRICMKRSSAQPELLEKIMYRNNLNRVFKRVRANKGAQGVEGMSTDEAFSYLKENKQELIGRIMKGKYTPSLVRRVEIPKTDGGVRKLGILTVIDGVIQQTIAQQPMPIFESFYTGGSYGYRLGHSAHDVILKVKAGGIELIPLTLFASFEALMLFSTTNHHNFNILQKISTY